MKTRAELRRDLIDIVDFLVPPRIWQSNPTTDVVTRARVLSGVLYCALSLHIVAFVVLVSCWLFVDQQRFASATLILGAVLLIVLFQCLLLRWLADLAFSSRLFCQLYLLMLLVSVCTTGGWRSPVLPLLITMPAFVFLTSNWKRAQHYALLCLLIGLALMLSEVLNWSPPNLMNPDNFAWAQGIVWWLASLYMMLLFKFLNWMYVQDRVQGGNGFGRLHTVLDESSLSLPLSLSDDEVEQALSRAKQLAQQQATGRLSDDKTQ